jgi:hypothetical protein
VETISEIIQSANAVAADIEAVNLLKESFEIWEILDESEQIEKNQCPCCKENLSKKKGVYVGHEDWCFYLRVQNVLIMKGVKVPDFSWH